MPERRSRFEMVTTETNESGVTLVELVIVVTIIGILVAAFGFSFQGWQGNYQIESQTKMLYADLMEAKMKSITRNIVYFAVINSTGYQLYEDTNNNGVYDGATDTPVWTDPATNASKPKTLQYGWNLKRFSAGSLPLTFTFDTRGVVSPGLIPVYFSIDSTGRTPDYDCILVTSARISMGKWDGVSGCVEK